MKLESNAGVGRVAASLVVFLTVIVVAQRLTGIDYLLPHDPEADRFALFQVEYIRATPEERVGLEPMRFFYFYPLFIARLVLLFPEPEPADAALDADGLTAHLRAASLLNMQGRSVVAFFSVLSVLGTWWIARRLIGPWPALLATAWMAANLTCVIYAGQARPHAIAGGLGTLAVASSLLLRRRPTVGVYLLAGVANGAAVGALHSAAAVLGSLFVAHLLRDRDERFGGAWKAILPIAAIAGSVYFFYPGFYDLGQGAKKALDVQATGIDFGWILDHRAELGSTFSGAGFVRLAKYTWGYEPVLVLASILGLAYALTRWPRGRDPDARVMRRDLAVVLGHALPYALVMGIYAHSPARYMIPLMPYLACLAAVGALWPARLLARRLSDRARRVVCVSASILWLALPTYAIAHLTSLRLRPDTREEMAGWMLEHLPEGARVLLGPGGWIPLDYGQGAIGPANRNTGPVGIPWFRYQLQLSDHVREPRFDFELIDWTPPGIESFTSPARARRFLRESGADYLVIEDSDRVRVFEGKVYENLRRAARELGGLEHAFHPRGPDGERLYHDYDHSWRMLARTLETNALGPTVEIWRLRR